MGDGRWEMGMNCKLNDRRGQFRQSSPISHPPTAIHSKAPKQPLMQQSVACDDWTTDRINVTPLEVGHATTSFANQQQAGGDVPRSQPKLPERVKVPRGEPGKIERSTSGPSNP